MAQWESGKLDCSTVSPDASILGLRSSKWNSADQTMYASSMVIAVVNPQAAEVLGKFFHKDPKALNFVDIVSVAGRNWAELAPGNAEVANWGMVKGHAPDCVRSASCQVVSVALAYSASGQANMTGRELSDPKVKSVIDAFRDKLDHTEASTGRLTQKCFLNPVECDFFFTYESRIPDVEKQIPGAIVVYNDRVIPADQVVLVTTNNPPQREAAVRFIEHIMSATDPKTHCRKIRLPAGNRCRRPGAGSEIETHATGHCPQSEPYPGQGRSCQRDHADSTEPDRASKPRDRARQGGVKAGKRHDAAPRRHAW
jgi:hypothetical protein